MTDLVFVYGTLGLMVATLVIHAARRTFDPFAPVWLFFVGYSQIYVFQAITYRAWALEARGSEVVAWANFRAVWALAWFLLVYHLGIGRAIARWLPRPPSTWSPTFVVSITPPLILWGLLCAGMVLRSSAGAGEMSAEESLFRSFPLMMLVAGILLVVTGRQPERPQPMLVAAGLMVSLGYVVIWMFNGKRSHSLLGLLSTLCAFYVSRGKRPAWPMLAATGIVGALVVSLALGWRGNNNYEPTFAGFGRYISEFSPASVLENLNLKGRESGDGSGEYKSYETEEYGGFLLMISTVPDLAGYDYGAPYLRCVSTFIPRILWPGKPLFGREQWIAAWVAGSEMPREETFTGPAIGILGAGQLNGGAIGTAILLACLAIVLRTAYEYFRLHEHVPWTQAWWALTYYNAWFMTVADDPLNWFYYSYGYSTLPPMVGLWILHKFFVKDAVTGAPDPSDPPHG